MISGKAKPGTAIVRLLDDVGLGVEVAHRQPDHLVQADDPQLVSHDDHVPDFPEELDPRGRDVDQRGAWPED